MLDKDQEKLVRGKCENYMEAFRKSGNKTDTLSKLHMVKNLHSDNANAMDIVDGYIQRVESGS